MRGGSAVLKTPRLRAYKHYRYNPGRNPTGNTFLPRLLRQLRGVEGPWRAFFFFFVRGARLRASAPRALQRGTPFSRVVCALRLSGAPQCS